MTFAQRGDIGMARRMLFHRTYEAYSGGHGKVWDYFNHALDLGFDARIHFSPQSRRDGSNPWSAVPGRWIDPWQPEAADLLFVAGLDWLAVPPGLEHRVPVVNLIQSVRHADAGQPLRGFLRRRAIRICVGEEVAAAVRATGEVNGPVHVVPAGLRLPAIAPSQRRGVLVDGIKRPELGRALVARLGGEGVATELVLEHRPRDAYLAALATAEIAVLLPLEREGFYLPALEAMALGTPVVTLDAIGNREYLRPDENALVTAPDPALLSAAVMGLLAAPLEAGRRVRAGLATAGRFSMEGERRSFALIVDGSGSEVEWPVSSH